MPLSANVSAVLGGRCSFCLKEVAVERAMFASNGTARMCRECVALAAEMRGIRAPTSFVGSGIQPFASEGEVRVFLDALGVANEAAASFNDRLQELAKRMGLDEPVTAFVAAAVGPIAARPQEKRVCSFCNIVGTHPPMVIGGAKGEQAVCEDCVRLALRLLSEDPRGT